MSAAPPPLKAAHLAPLLAALAMLGPFSIDTFFPAFRVMAADLGVSATAMQQTISVYLAAYAVMSLFHGPLSDAYGRRNTILVSTALFALASAGCMLTPGFTGLLFFRAAQGLAAGAGLIVGRAIIRDRFAGPDAQKLMSQISLIFGVAPAIAPVAGGLLVGVSGWRSIFGVLALFSAAVWLWCLRLLPETHAPAARRPLSARALAQTYGGMLRDPVFVALSIGLAGNFGALFVYIASAPVFVMDHLHLNERQFAWLFVPAIAGMMLGATVSGRLAHSHTPQQTMRIAYQLMGGGVLVNLLVSALLTPSVPWTVLPITIFSMGMAVAFPTASLLLLDRFPATRGAVSSLQSAFILTSNAVLSGLTVPLISHHISWLAAYATGSIGLGYCCWCFASARLKPAAGSAVIEGV